jgi:hypothetical protein
MALFHFEPFRSVLPRRTFIDEQLRHAWIQLKIVNTHDFVATFHVILPLSQSALNGFESFLSSL